MKLQQEELQQQRDLFSRTTVTTQQQVTQPVSNNGNTWSFTQGLVIGQVSVIFIIIVFVKFFVLLIPHHISPQSLVLMVRPGNRQT